ncbi:hypothetical protein PC110_g16841 [Phytophthora cactorum]|uniref:Uncharacterized protein n=1 Tax=Phytophthora cactorum TaxID=29920 RepID=A0A329RPZ9_9STRA|nr:hypothetical protein PC110_g16841 [Phytophthora cactorum]
MIMWTHNLCKELRLKRPNPTVLFKANQAAIVVLTEIKGNYKTNSVDLKNHKVRDFHKRGEFERFRQLLNVMQLPMVIEDGNTDGCD